MRARRIVSLASFAAAAVVAAGAALMSTSVGAQAPSGAARTPRTVLRMADGHPDLQGTYDVTTITPLERPSAFGNRQTLTRAEAEAAEGFEEKREVENSAPISPDRAAPEVGGDRAPARSYLEGLFKFGGGTVGGYNSFWLAQGTTAFTVNGEKRTSIIVEPENGRVPAVIPDARKRNAAYLADRVSPDAAESAATGPASTFDNPEQRPLAERCLLGFGSTSGPPTLPNYFYNNLKQIVQAPGYVMILNEMVHDARVVRMGGQHLPQTVRRWMGDSIGHWEGDTLVVDTTNFTDKTLFQGSSESLHVTERFTRTDAKTILYQFTVEDPTTWSRPWKGEYPWVGTEESLYEYACHEGNHALSHVMSGARATEREAAAANKSTVR